jgi:DNA gyrase subunit A
LTNPTAPGPEITPVTIEEEMERSYLDYAMSVIVSRALPDVRDGLKPVQRRILYGMKENGFDWNRPFRKSARIVGEVMGKYHPHGDAAIYDAMVRMAQDFSMRLPLIDGQGNFGSMDGDPAAAMRYTEARLARVTESLLEDIDRDTVDFQSNYDDSSREPTVLPARFPNLLVNGASGIAVGMATNIPTHNLGEVIDACLAMIENPDITVEQVMELVPGPDFPTGGIILGRQGINEAYRTGRGSIVMRAKLGVEEIRKDRMAIVVTEVPFQCNKSRLLERIAEMVQQKTIEGISDLRDESDRHGVRVVIELKRDANSDVVLNQLYRYSQLQTSFGVNMLALRGGRPDVLDLCEMIRCFLAFREEVIRRRTVFELARARERAHILVGLAIAVANLDAMIKLIRESSDPNKAREQMIARAWPVGDVAPLIKLIDEPGLAAAEGTYRLSDEQARAILDLRLQRLTGLEREKLATELGGTVDKIAEYLGVLGSREKLLGQLRGELTDIKQQFATPRRTTIEEGQFETDIEDLIQREDMVVTLTHAGYIKRVPLSAYRAQKRGGKGRSSMATREEDFVTSLFAAVTHAPVLFFSSRGLAYRMKVYRLPLGNPQARGRPLVQLLPLQEGETITAMLPLPEDEAIWDSLYLMFATASGYVRRNLLSDFRSVMANGKIAMKLDEGDRLVDVSICSEDQDILLATRQGKCIRFPVPEVRVFTGRTSTGVRGIELQPNDDVIGMSLLGHSKASSEQREEYLSAAQAKRRLASADYTGRADDRRRDEALALKLSDPMLADLESREEFLLTVASNGFGKRSSSYEYRITRRGGKGIELMDLGAQATVAAAFPVKASDQIMSVSDGGTLIRCHVSGVRLAGRSTRGVTIAKVPERERVVSVTRLADEGEEMPATGAATPTEPMPEVLETDVKENPE